MSAHFNLRPPLSAGVEKADIEDGLSCAAPAKVQGIWFTRLNQPPRAKT